MKTRARATVTSGLVLGLVFVSGALVGRAWDERTAEARPVEEASDSASESSQGEARGERRRGRMYEQVGLDDAQHVVIDSIVVHFRSDLRTLQAAYRERYQEQRGLYEQEYDALLDSVRGAIKAVMNPEQRAQYDSLLKASDERERARREERERGGQDDQEGR